MSVEATNNRIKITLGIFIFRVILDFLYSKFVATIFGYTGFKITASTGRYVMSWLVLLIFVPIVIRIHKKTTISSIAMMLLVYWSVVPFTTMIAFYPYELVFIFQNTIYWLILFTLYNLIPKINLVRIKNDSLVNFFIKLVILSFFVSILYISWRFTGFRITIDLSNVYNLRSEVINFRMPTILSYIYSASKAVNPVLVVYYLSNKKYSIAGFILFIQLLSFSINGSKTVLFSTLLAVILYWFYNEKYKNRAPWMFVVLGVLGAIEVYLNKTYLIIAFFIRRVFFVPNLLNYYYYDFFTANTPDYLRQSFLRHFGLRSPYSAIDNLIGLIYFNKPEMGANSGLISDAYANFGILGLVIMPFVIVFALKIIDACSEGLDIRIFVVSGVTLAFIFVSSFFFTILVTHGFLVLCLILYFLPRNNKYF